MQAAYNNILFSILDIINYQNDKELFVKEFEALNILDAMGYLIPKLPQNIQESIRACGDDPEKIKQLIPEEAYKKEFIKVSFDALDELLASVLPTVTPLQKEKIGKLISSQQHLI
jgi:hypothetical protein